jgi:glycosyltransferase involved in cell wall biosynthesis
MIPTPRARVSVLMPVHNQAAFLPRALDSLTAQTPADWELIIVDDGSDDATPRVLASLARDARVRVVRLPENRGMGAALNVALAEATAPLVAYLPADDVYHAGHLASLADALDGDTSAVLAYSGVRHHYNRLATGIIEGYGLQPVQVMHRRTPDRWTERTELVSDDHGRLFFDKLKAHGGFIATGRVSCEWVDHPEQTHKVIREPVGGINTYRDRYRVAHPLRFHTTVGNRIDEVAHYRRFRERPDTPRAADGLRILMVGELAYNPERVLALEERGHSLFGLWMPRPYWYNNVGPVAFGHVTDLDRRNWRRELRRLRPDVVYALLNWQAVPFAHEVLTELRETGSDVPFVWHFKEGPFISLEKGHWDKLADLHALSDGNIYSSPEMAAWTATAVPGSANVPTHILDGDLPKAEWFDAPLPARDPSWPAEEIHTVVPGRPIGLHPHTVAGLAERGIHLHFYGDFTHGQWRQWIDKAMSMVRGPGRLHLHANVDQGDWVAEFGRYDAGWLHVFESRNGGDLRRADWDDLNIPARLATLAAAGLPVIQRENPGHVVATQRVAAELDIGVFFRDLDDLAAKLRDAAAMSRVRQNMRRLRHLFTFDAHADALVGFFRRVIAGKRSASPGGIPSDQAAGA